jgi:hypothetical protein
MPPPAFEHASIARCIALVEFVTLSPVAPCEFAEKIRVPFGSLLAPTSLTHEGKPFAPVGEFAWAETCVATAEADARAKKHINVKQILRFFVILLATS